jgi:hypothetical protein
LQTAKSTMFDPNNIDQDSLGSILKEMGRDDAGTRFNIFRRFREAVLQRSEARQILIDYWMGHSNASMGDRYGKQLEDVEYRQDQRLVLVSIFRRRYLGYVGYKFSKASSQPNV